MDTQTAKAWVMVIIGTIIAVGIIATNCAQAQVYTPAPPGPIGQTLGGTTNTNTNTNTTRIWASGGNASAGAVAGAISGSHASGGKAVAEGGTGYGGIGIGKGGQGGAGYGEGGAGGNGYGGKGGAGGEGGKGGAGGSVGDIDAKGGEGGKVLYKEAEQKRNPVSSALAAPLVASPGACMGSTSAGAQSVSVGVSVGSTWTDEHCQMLNAAAALAGLGMVETAKARLCADEAIAKAMAASGEFQCPKEKEEQPKVAGIPDEAWGD